MHVEAIGARSGRGLVVNATDLHPASLGSTPTGNLSMSYWWRQEGHLDKIAPVLQYKSYFGRHLRVLE